MSDFFREDAKEVQDAGQRCRVSSEGGDYEGQHVLPFGHLDSQIGQTHTQLQPNGLRSGMEGREVSHQRFSQIRERLARYLVEVVDNLGTLKPQQQPRYLQ